MRFKEHVRGGRLHARRGSLKPGLIGAALLAALVAAISVPAVFANAGDPDSTQATWQYQDPNNPNGPVVVTVSGTWSWGTNPSGGKDSQSCWSGSNPQKAVAGYDDVNGHWAVGIAVSWNDSSTPNTLTGKNTSGQPVTLHVGNSMDWLNPNYCAGTTASNPYPSGTFTAQHTYPSLAAFNAAIPNGGMCVNAYDVHQDTAKEEDPSQNGDNTLHNNHYALSVDCATAAENNPPPASNPAMTVVKTERIGSASYTRGPITGNVGDRVDYQMLVQDTGNTDLSVTLSDPHCDSGTITPSGSVTLHPNDTATFFCSHVLQSGDAPVFTNVATATAGVLNASSQTTGTITAQSSVDTNVNPPATCPSGQTMVNGTCQCPSGQTMVNGTCQTPPATTTPAPTQPGSPPPADLNIVKLERIGATGAFVLGPIAGHVGDTVFYEMLVTNPSSDPYTLNVTLSDPHCDANTLAPSAVVTLAPGQEQTYTCSHVLVAADQPQFTNTATATAGPLNASASVQGVTRSASVVANVGPAAQVKGVTKTITKKAKPAPKKAVVKAASFTG